MKKIIIPIIIIAVATAVFIFIKSRNGGSDSDISFTGTVEVTEVDLSFKVAGRIKDVLAEEGNAVKAGEDVASLDDADLRLAVASAKANVDLSQAALNELLAGSRRQEIQNAQSAVDKANASLNKTKDDMAQAAADRERFDFLYRNGGISKHDFELYDTKYKTASSTVQEAQASVKSAEDNLSLALEGTRSETIKKAGAAVAVAKAALNTAQQNLKYAVVYSPINGTVLTRSAEPGEFVQPGSVILSVADLSDAWVRGYVSEKDLGRIHLGDQVTVKCDAYPDQTFNGRISYISDEAEFTPKTVETQEERVNFMYRIKVTLDNRKGVLKYGMPVDGTIVLSKNEQ